MVVSAPRPAEVMRRGLSRMRRAIAETRGAPVRDGAYPADFDRETIALIERVAPFSVTSPERIAALAAATEHVVRARIPGALIECGVWKGGSMMAAALTLVRLGGDDRDLYLFDTFTGMSKPTDVDVETAAAGPAPSHASDTWQSINDWAAIGQGEVRANLLSTGYPSSRLYLVEGKVEDTLPAAAPESIALLRLDTDWYESTAHELRHLYPRLSRGGILLVDDYGHWSGARRAVDEYFGHDRPFLHRVDYTARLVVKP